MTTQEEKKSKKVKKIVRLLISVILIYVIYSSVDFEKLLATLQKVSLPTAIAIPILYAAGQIVSCMKWRIFIKAVDISRSFGDILRAYFLGMFVNTFGLGTLGGDLTRAIAITPPKGKRLTSFATVVADRIHGLIVLATIAVIATLVWGPEIFPTSYIVLAWLGLLAIVLGWFVGPAIVMKFTKEHTKLGRLVRLLSIAFISKPKQIANASAISLFFHCFQIFMHYLIVRELEAPIALSYLFIAVPIANIASSLPISTSGIGVREAAYIFMFSRLGIPNETSIAIGAIWTTSVILVSGILGLLFPPDKNIITTAEETEFDENLENVYEQNYEQNYEQRYKQQS